MTGPAHPYRMSYSSDVQPRSRDGKFASKPRAEDDGVTLEVHATDSGVYAVAGSTRQTKTPLTSMSLSSSNSQARETARLVTDGQMIVDAPYQRGSVWTLDQRIALVKSWLQGIPVPGILVNDRCTTQWRDANGYTPLDTGHGLYAVVDGRQRVETAVAWYDSDFAVPASWFNPEHVDSTEDTPDGPYVRYAGLTEVGQRLTANRFMLPVSTGQVATVEEEASLYLLVNGGGTAQTEADMANAANVAAGMRK